MPPAGGRRRRGRARHPLERPMAPTPSYSPKTPDSQAKILTATSTDAPSPPTSPASTPSGSSSSTLLATALAAVPSTPHRLSTGIISRQALALPASTGRTAPLSSPSEHSHPMPPVSMPTFWKRLRRSMNRPVGPRLQARSPATTTSAASPTRHQPPRHTDSTGCE